MPNNGSTPARNYIQTFRIFLGLVLTIIPEVRAWSYGAPPSTCKSLYPVHGIRPQDYPCPYSISPDKTTIFSNESVTVIIAGDWFKGFIMMAKPTGHWQMRWQKAVGRFRNNFGLNVFDCYDMTDNAVTQSVSQYNDDVEVVWSPPPDFEGRVTFLATVLKNYKTFWTLVHSPAVKVIRR